MIWIKFIDKQPQNNEFVLVVGYYINLNMEVDNRVDYAWYSNGKFAIGKQANESWPVHYWISIPEIPNSITHHHPDLLIKLS